MERNLHPSQLQHVRIRKKTNNIWYLVFKVVGRMQTFGKNLKDPLCLRSLVFAVRCCRRYQLCLTINMIKHQHLYLFVFSLFVIV